jgi:hypothetical protein
MSDDLSLDADDVRAALAGRASFPAEFRVGGHPIPVTVEVDTSPRSGAKIGWLRGWLAMGAADFAAHCDYYHVLGVLAFGDVAIPACVQGRPPHRDEPRLDFVSAGPATIDAPDPFEGRR